MRVLKNSLMLYCIWLSLATALTIRQGLEEDPSVTPAIPPPPGVVSNLTNPPNWQWAAIFAMVLYVVTTSIFFIARMYARIYVHRKLWWDDYCMMLGWVGLLSFVGVVLKNLKYGYATDEWHVSKAHAAHFREIFSKLEIVARLGIFFTKTSILLLYIRYFCPTLSKRPAIWWWTWGVIMFNLLYCIALILTVTLQCVGRHRAPGQSCINSWAVLVGASLINVLTDLVMLAIPIIAVSKLHTTKTRKIGLVIVFAIAALAVAASAARLGYQLTQSKSLNQTILITHVVILALAEHAIGIIVGCMPTIPSLYNYIRNRGSETSLDDNGRPSFSGRKYPVSSRHRKHRGRWADTTLLATETNNQTHEMELGHNNNGSGFVHERGNFIKVETVKNSDIELAGGEVAQPQQALLQKEKEGWPMVEKTVRVDVNSVPARPKRGQR